jgi:hypothetical protein
MWIYNERYADRHLLGPLKGIESHKWSSTISDLILNWRSMELKTELGFCEAYTQLNAHSPFLIQPGTTDPLFLFALLKFIFWHSLGIGVLSRQKSMHLSPLHA